MSVDYQTIDFCITTLDRYAHLEQLIDSIFKYYPNARITVADQSKNIDYHFYMNREVSLISLPYDCGLSYARNKLVECTKRPYILILEDDFLFTEDTKVEKLLTLSEKYDIIGGGVYRKDYRIPFEFYFEKRGNELWQIPDGDKWQEYKGITYKETGCILNFALFNRRVFKDVQWDNRLKLREHQHFFYRVHKKIAFTDEVKIIDNKGKQSNEYKALKGRDEFWKIAMEDLGITKVIYTSGRVVELEDNLIKRYAIHRK